MLFPEPKGPRLIGIARAASEAELLESKRRITYHQLNTGRFIGRASRPSMPFDWTINPYRGCEFGCKYCYARYTHEFMELHLTEQFEREIFVKRFQPEAFRQELARIPWEESIAIGTATDPYQPAERRFGITRSILEIFATQQGRYFSITTKSSLVARDTQLIARIARRNVMHILVTCTTTDEKLARLLEPLAPSPELRFRAIRHLADAGVRVAVLANPVMPGITSSEENLRSVAKAAKAAGALYLHGGLLFLKPCAQKAFFPFLQDHYPHLVKRYRERYEAGHYLKGEYQTLIAERVEAIRQEFGLANKLERYSPVLPVEQDQLNLF
ncbi:MAG: radical SAM protein [Bryobacteraceae bacterium]